MTVDKETYFKMRWWCINNIPTINSYRQWYFDDPKEQKVGEPYKFTPIFDRAEDESAFRLAFLVEAIKKREC